MWIDDLVLKQCQNSIAYNIFQIREPLIVLGRSNQAEREVNLATCTEDAVPVLRRRGGGGTVLLSPGVVVVSMGMWVRHLYNNKFYFERINAAVISALAAGFSDFAHLQQRGLSDIAFNERKVAGTSLFRSRHYLLYQASLLVTLDIDMIERYLLHPSSEPDYRQGKSHRDFLTCLQQIEPRATAASIEATLQNQLPTALSSYLDEELIAPELDHSRYLLGRLQD